MQIWFSGFLKKTLKKKQRNTGLNSHHYQTLRQGHCNYVDLCFFFLYDKVQVSLTLSNVGKMRYGQRRLKKTLQLDLQSVVVSACSLLSICVCTSFPEASCRLFPMLSKPSHTAAMAVYSQQGRGQQVQYLANAQPGSVVVTSQGESYIQKYVCHFHCWYQSVQISTCPNYQRCYL